MSLVKDIGDYIQQKGHGVVGENIFLGSMPDAPDSIIGVFKYAGRQSDNLARISRPGLQIRVRASGYEEANNTIEQIQDELSQIGDEFNDTLNEGVEINGSFYLRVNPIQSPSPLGEDGKERMEFVQNYEIDRRMT